LKSRNAFRFNGLIHQQTVGVEAAADGKGVVLVTKKSAGQRKPAKSYNKVQLKRNARQTFSVIRKTLRGGRYRKDLKYVSPSQMVLTQCIFS